MDQSSGYFARARTGTIASQTYDLAGRGNSEERPDPPRRALGITFSDSEAMADLPEGTLTFLFTDLEESTELLKRLGPRYGEVLTEYRRLLGEAFRRRDGHEVDTQGDASFVVFDSARGAVTAAVEAQRLLLSHPWPLGTSVRTRMGLHTGEAARAGPGYVGLDVHRAARIQDAAHGGQILVSATTRELIAEDLPEGITLRDLGEHRLKGLTQNVRLVQVIAPGLPNQFPPPRALRASPNNLPPLLTNFIGRTKETGEVKELLSSARLVTLVGAGGCGKTRLALEVGADLIEGFEDGVWFVELDAISDPALVPHAVASALGVRDRAGQAIATTVTDFLQHKRALLILDNCEHLLGACAPLCEALLRACPNLRVLATSRERLGLEGEVTYRVPSLSLPSLMESRPGMLNGMMDRVKASDAVCLFIDRARLSRPDFELTSRNAHNVVEVCRRLDGIPLAIELAAARVKVLSVEQIAERLEDCFQLLTRGSWTALPRRQTLEAAIAWSYDMLREQERALFRRLSVFAGGFTLDAAEEVCGGSADGFAVLDALDGLIDKSLLIFDEQARDPRYRMLETIRQYARDRLKERDEIKNARDCHTDFFQGLAESSEAHLNGPDQELWLNRLEAEHDNMRAAIEWCLSSGEIEQGLRIAGGLAAFWWIRNHFSEGRQWLERLLAESESAPAALRAKALNGAAFLAWGQADYVPAVALSTESLNLCRSLDDPADTASALAILGSAALGQGVIDQAENLLTESLALFTSVNHRWGRAFVLDILGHLELNRDRPERAVELWHQSLGAWRDLGQRLGMAYELNNLGLASLAQGDFDKATSLHHESLTHFRSLGDRRGIALAFHNLGNVEIAQRDYEGAISCQQESLALYREIGDKRGVANSLLRIADALRAQESHRRTGELYRASLEIFRELGDEGGVAACLKGLQEPTEAQA